MFFFVSILLLSLFDILATHYTIVVYGSFAVEANPIMRYVMEEFGLRSAYVFRMIGPLIGVPTLLWIRSQRQIGTWMLWLTLIAHLLLLGWHLYVTQVFTLHLR